LEWFGNAARVASLCAAFLFLGFPSRSDSAHETDAGPLSHPSFKFCFVPGETSRADDYRAREIEFPAKLSELGNSNTAKFLPSLFLTQEASRRSAHAAFNFVAKETILLRRQCHVPAP
jgi:hypothetical protein